MPNYAAGTGGAQAPGPNAGANTNQGSGQLPQNRKNKKRRRVNGQVQYKWPNGTWHSRPYGKEYREKGGGGGNAQTLRPSGGGQGNDKFSRPGEKPGRHPLLDRANALADIRYGGAEQSLNQRGLAIRPWFQNYMNTVSTAQAMNQQYAAPIAQQAQQRADQSGQVAPGLDPNSQAGQDAALAGAARQAMGNALVTALQSVNQVQQNYLTGRKAVAATAEAGEQSKLASDRTALAKEKGTYVTETVGELRDKRRQQKLENAAFGLKASTESQKLNKYGYTTQEWNSFSDAKRNRIRNKSSSSSSAGPDLGEVNKYGVTEKKWRNMSQAERQKIIRDFDKGGGKDDGPSQFTPTQRHATKATIRKGMAAVKGQIGAPGYSAQAFWSRAYNGLVNEKDYDPLLARAIIQRMRHGRVNAKVAKRLKKNYGITLGSGKKVKLPEGPSSIPVVGGVVGLGGTG